MMGFGVGKVMVAIAAVGAPFTTQAQEVSSPCVAVQAGGPSTIEGVMVVIPVPLSEVVAWIIRAHGARARPAQELSPPIPPFHEWPEWNWDEEAGVFLYREISGAGPRLKFALSVVEWHGGIDTFGCGPNIVAIGEAAFNGRRLSQAEAGQLILNAAATAGGGGGLSTARPYPLRNRRFESFIDKTK
jgi:hypothetical protein